MPAGMATAMPKMTIVWRLWKGARRSCTDGLHRTAGATDPISEMGRSNGDENGRMLADRQLGGPSSTGRVSPYGGADALAGMTVTLIRWSPVAPDGRVGRGVASWTFPLPS